MPAFRIEGGKITFWLDVKPNAPRERLQMDAAGQLSLSVHAAPTEGRVNEACVRFLARRLRLPPTSVEIVARKKSRRKLIRITGTSPHDTVDRLVSLMAKK